MVLKSGQGSKTLKRGRDNSSFGFARQNIQMRGLNCLSCWRIVLCELWEVVCVFTLKADFWTAGAGAGGCFASISLDPRTPLPSPDVTSTLRPAPPLLPAHMPCRQSKAIITPFNTTLSPTITSTHAEWSTPTSSLTSLVRTPNSHWNICLCFVYRYTICFLENRGRDIMILWWVVNPSI